MLRVLLSIIGAFIVLFLLGTYLVVQYQQDASFISAPLNSSFPSYTNGSLQFYPNMRFPSAQISYQITDCPLKKRSDMLDAFAYLENKTVLTFYPIDESPEIIVTCSSEVKESEKGFFVAGEGGPLNITATERFYVISRGKVLLLRDSSCAQSIIGLHELLHVLGFDHSTNPNSIMYPVSGCSQVLTDDIVDTLNTLYATPSFADLSFSNASAQLHDGYLDVNFTVGNQGLVDASESHVVLRVDDTHDVDRVDLDTILVGYGRIIKLKNIRVFPQVLHNLTIDIETSFPEIDTANNRLVLVPS